MLWQLGCRFKVYAMSDPRRGMDAENLPFGSKVTVSPSFSDSQTGNAESYTTWSWGQDSTLNLLKTFYIEWGVHVNKLGNALLLPSIEANRSVNIRLLPCDRGGSMLAAKMHPKSLRRRRRKTWRKKGRIRF